MKSYHGLRGGKVSVIVDRESYSLDPRADLAVYDLRFQQPVFGWGHHGYAPAQLALAILADYTDDDQFALDYAMEFKREIIAKLQQNMPFTLADAEIGYFVSTFSETGIPPKGDVQ